MSKRTDQLTALTDNQVAEDSRLFPIADPATGQLSKCTNAQLKKALSTHKKKYVATGSEGSTLTIAELAGKNIIAIIRESGPIFETDASPDSVEYIWDGTNISLGNVTGSGERFLILYNNFNG